MLFKFLEKPIVLECFSSSEQILETAPITNAIKQMPDWWKKLPDHYVQSNSFAPSPTMRGCVGMIEYYTNSVALPLWSDVYIKVDGRRYWWQYSDQSSLANPHNLEDEATDFVQNHGHIKLITPWIIRTKEDVNWVWSQPLYSFAEENFDLKVIPGVLNFKHQVVANVNMLLPLDQEKIYKLNFGQVLAHLTPMSNRRVEIKRYLVDENEFKRLGSMHKPTSFLNKYRKIIKNKQKFSDCPYHRG